MTISSDLERAAAPLYKVAEDLVQELNLDLPSGKVASALERALEGNIPGIVALLSGSHKEKSGGSRFEVDEVNMSGAGCVELLPDFPTLSAAQCD